MRCFRLPRPRGLWIYFEALAPYFERLRRAGFPPSARSSTSTMPESFGSSSGGSIIRRNAWPILQALRCVIPRWRASVRELMPLLDATKRKAASIQVVGGSLVPCIGVLLVALNCRPQPPHS